MVIYIFVFWIIFFCDPAGTRQYQYNPKWLLHRHEWGLYLEQASFHQDDPDTFARLVVRVS